MESDVAATTPSNVHVEGDKKMLDTYEIRKEHISPFTDASPYKVSPATTKGEHQLSLASVEDPKTTLNKIKVPLFIEHRKPVYHFVGKVQFMLQEQKKVADIKAVEEAGLNIPPPPELLKFDLPGKKKKLPYTADKNKRTRVHFEQMFITKVPRVAGGDRNIEPFKGVTGADGMSQLSLSLDCSSLTFIIGFAFKRNNSLILHLLNKLTDLTTTSRRTLTLPRSFKPGYIGILKSSLMLKELRKG
ncbi:hypothetical protein Tco_0991341 [Tanacetum coccineum]|uniref:Uncharacterized protein n=1 Tax=Tanacetum coccineum TaxID=301880 RepID=A0ABQ5F0G0_9ASTR